MKFCETSICRDGGACATCRSQGPGGVQFRTSVANGKFEDVPGVEFDCVAEGDGRDALPMLPPEPEPEPGAPTQQAANGGCC